MVAFSSAELTRALREHFAVETFLSDQEPAVQALVSGRDSYVNIRTGGGKSLCYQLASQLLDGVTIVISPLIALIRDQVTKLRSRGIPVAFLESSQSLVEARQNIRRVCTNQVKLLYLSPERFCSKGLITDLEQVKIALIVVDEAHCVSVWGHDFRPEYQRIGQVRHRLKKPPMAAVTATASVRVRDDALALLGLEDPIQVVGDMDRPNLRISVTPCQGLAERDSTLMSRLTEYQKLGQTGIVYCSRVKSTEALCETARARGIRAAFYHGQMENEDRHRVQAEFNSNMYTALFATKAFGMGVDKSDIRFVLHAEMPDSLEAYWQEIGRGGRDGEPAECDLVYSVYETRLSARFLGAQNPDVSVIKYYHEMLCRRIAKGDETKDRPSFKFFQRKFIDDLSQDNPYKASAIRASLASLEEFGLWSFEGGTATRLVSPEQLDEQGFPITTEFVNQKRMAAEHRLAVMLHFARFTGDRRQVIFDHFLRNSVAEQVLRDYSGTWLGSLSHTFLKEVLLAASVRDYAPAGLRTAVVTQLAKDGVRLTAAEARYDIEHAEMDGYLRSVPVGDSTFVTLTDEGVAHLSAAGHTVEPPKTWEALKLRILSPHAKAILKGAIEPWFTENTRANMLPNQWWRVIEQFYDTEFRLFGKKKVKGSDLARAYCHVSAARTKVGGVWLRHGKVLLNALFDNKVVT